MRSTDRALLILVLLLVLPAAARAGGSNTSIYGDRRMGMLATLARPDDTSAVFHNPAGLADQPGVQAYLFVSPAFLSSTFQLQALDPQRFPKINPEECGQAGQDPCPWPVDAQGYYTGEIEPERYFGVIPFVGVSTDLGFLGRAGRNVVAALAVYTPNFYGAYLPEDAPTAYHAIGGVFLVISGTAAVGWRINRYISVGANLSYNYMYLSMARKLSLANALTPAGQTPSGLATIAQGLLGDIRFDYEGEDHGLGWNLSLILSPFSWLSIGLGYSGAMPPCFEGPVTFRAYSEQVTDEQTLHDLVRSVGYKLPRELEVELPLPHTLQAGVNLALGKQVELGVDLRLWLYNLFERQTIRPVYDPAAPGKEPLSEASLSRDKDYRLSYQLVGGVLVRPLARYPSLELMTGGGYDYSPIPDSTYSLDNPNLSHYKVTVGVRFRISDAWRLSLTYLLNLYASRDIRNSSTDPPTNVRAASHSHSPALAVGYTY